MSHRTLKFTVPALAGLLAAACNKSPSTPNGSYENPPTRASTSTESSASPAPQQAMGGSGTAEQGTPRDQQTAERRATELPHAGRTEGTTLPAGTTLSIRVTNPISTSSVHDGDLVTGELASAVVENGQEVLPAGTRVNGRVVAATNDPRKHPDSLEIEMLQLDSRSGDHVPIRASHFKKPAAAQTGATLKPGDTIEVKLEEPATL